MSGLFRTALPAAPVGGDAVANPTTGEMNGEPPAQTKTLFDDVNKAGAETETETETAAPTEPMVTLTDGSQVSAKEYMAQQNGERETEIAAEKARLEERERWLQPPDNGNQGNDEPPAEEEVEPVKFEMPDIDPDSFESDTEKVMYNAMKNMGEQTTTMVNELRSDNKNLRDRLADTDRLTRDTRMDGEFARVEAQYGVTRQEVMDIHRDSPNSFDIDLLAEVAKSRKGAAEAETETKTEVQTQRTADLAKVNGASNDRGASREDFTNLPGRGVKDYKNATEVAQRYSML